MHRYSVVALGRAKDYDGGHRALSVQGGEGVIQREGQAMVAARTGLQTAKVPQRTAAAKVVPRIVAHGRCESHALPTVPQRSIATVAATEVNSGSAAAAGSTVSLLPCAGTQVPSTPPCEQL